jgi:hypothetical protein
LTTLHARPVNSIILLRGAQIVHSGSLSGDERPIVITACAYDQLSQALHDGSGH